MIYLDSNVFIFSFLSDDQHSSTCKKILEEVASNTLRACTSALTWDEISWIAKKSLSKEDSIEEGKKFLEFPFLSLLPIDKTTINLAQNLVEKYALHPRDAIHAAAALQNESDGIVSDDADFDKVKELKRFTIEKAAKLKV